MFARRTSRYILGIYKEVIFFLPPRYKSNVSCMYYIHFGHRFYMSNIIKIHEDFFLISPILKKQSLLSEAVNL
jgi:hypothetical protein